MFPVKSEAEGLVEVAAGVPRGGRIRQVHHQRPGGAQVPAFLLRLGHGGDCFYESPFIHDASGRIELPAQEFVAAVSFDQADISLEAHR